MCQAGTSYSPSSLYTLFSVRLALFAYVKIDNLHHVCFGCKASRKHLKFPLKTVSSRQANTHSLTGTHTRTHTRLVLSFYFLPLPAPYGGFCCWRRRQQEVVDNFYFLFVEVEEGALIEAARLQATKSGT